MPLAYFKVIDGPDGRPDNSLPGSQPGVDNGLPQLPGAPDNTLPPSPPGIWPPLSPVHPVQPLPPEANVPPGTIWPSPGAPDNSLPGGGGGGQPDQGLPSQKFWVVAGIPGIGWRYVCVDPSLKPGNALPGSQPKPDQGLPSQPGRPDQGLPDTPQPKR